MQSEASAVELIVQPTTSEPLLGELQAGNVSDKAISPRTIKCELDLSKCAIVGFHLRRPTSAKLESRPRNPMQPGTSGSVTGLPLIDCGHAYPRSAYSRL